MESSLFKARKEASASVNCMYLLHNSSAASLARLALVASLLVTCSLLPAQSLDNVREIVDAARADSPRLRELFGHGLPEMHGRDGAVVWGQEFLFAIESASPASVAIDYQPPVAMKNVPGTSYWYKLAVLRLGTTHNYNYFADGKSLGAYDVAGYNPDSYSEPGVPRGRLSEMKTFESKIYPGMSANYWIYVNPGVDTVRGAPLMVWQDGETIVGTQDLVRLRMQIVTDNLSRKKSSRPWSMY